jgi:hypothetical protein
MPAPGSWSAEPQPGRGAWFAAAVAAIAHRLPFGLARIVAPSMVGFAVINSLTFAADLTLLIVLHGRLRWPVPVSVTVAYLAATSGPGAGDSRNAGLAVTRIRTDSPSPTGVGWPASGSRSSASGPASSTVTASVSPAISCW